MLTVRHTHVTSFLGSAFTVIAIAQTPREWKTIDRSLNGPRNWQRFGGLIHRNESLCYAIRLQTTPDPVDVDSIWLEYNSKMNGGQLTIHLPQTIGPSNVPVGTGIEIMGRKWVSAGDGPIHKSKWHPDLLQYGSCNVVPSDPEYAESNGQPGG